MLWCHVTSMMVGDVIVELTTETTMTMLSDRDTPESLWFERVSEICIKGMTRGYRK